ncbi:MAG: hypothetical protein KGJ57_20670 [Sphingomonadales bacterium]|nr:hypothetical protein [Sphingomonadales bacterium]MDE2171810.1 hypothetical protein [Sphingomonadales bacterium]
MAAKKTAGEQARAAQDQARARASDIDSAIALLRDALRKVEGEISARADAYPEVSLASVNLGVEVVQVAGHPVVLDSAGFHEAQTLRIFDATPVRRTVKRLKSEIDKLQDVPVMLSVESNAGSDDPLDTLYGEEDKISELVDGFSSGLGGLDRIEISLPLVEGGTALIKRLQAGELDPVSDPGALTVSAKASGDEINRFVTEINRARESGEEALATIREVADGLETVCTRYSEARGNSINALHTGLLDVLDKANWCNRRFYCPRTIMSPAYTQSLIGVDLADAHLLAIDELLYRLRSDGEIARRLDSAPELQTRLIQQYQSIRQIADHAGGGGAESGLSAAERSRIFNEEQAGLIKAFRLSLQEVMTGARHPLLEVSREAVLYFDPREDEWSSRVSPYRYSTPDAVRYGAIVKAYSDLMIPLWEHLWTEKADFRKSELFRTNQDMIRMTEKESEKLIDVANEFRADMRSVRENSNIFRADLTSKIDEIHEFRNSMDQIGLLSPTMQAAMSDDRIAALDIDGGAIDSIDGYENALTRAPQVQAETRGTMHDPIDYVREPDIVIQQIAPLTSRLAPALEASHG